MKILTLNCQKAYNPNLGDFLIATLNSEKYDFLLLQEATETVLAYIRENTDYTTLSHSQDGRPALVSVVYKKKVATLQDSTCELWPRAHSAEVHNIDGHISYGVLLCKFYYSGQSVVLGSVHLPAGINFYKRFLQLKKVKTLVNSYNNEGLCIFGGDCNFGYIGEIAKAKSLLKPRYTCVTDKLGATLNSYYTENSGHLPDRAAKLLRYFGVGIKLRADQVFVSADIVTKKGGVVSRILEDRVSDHSPVEIIVELS